MKRFFVFCVLAATAMALLVPAAAFSFPVPENLQFELAWNGIYAGTSTLSISYDQNHNYRIESTARSADFISLFYRVRDKAESLAKQGSFASIDYKLKTREGHHRKDKEVMFPDGAARSDTVYLDRMDKETKNFKTPPGILDALSSFYFVRTQPLVVGKSIHVTIFDEKKVWNVEVKVLRKEKVNTWAGSFNTVLIRPLLKSEGIFRSNGAIYIWLTDDARHMPVMLESHVKVGSIKAILQKVKY